MLKNISKKIVISLIIFIIFPIVFSDNIFTQTSEQADPFYEKLFQDGKYFYNKGNYPKAIENFKIAFFGFIDNESKLLECYIYLTVCYYEIKNLEKSKYSYNEIKRLKLQEYLKTIKPPKNLLDKYHEIASYFSRFEPQAKIPPSSKQILEAEIKQLKEAIKNNKKNFEAYFRLSAIYLKQKKIKAAKSILKDLIKVDKRNGNAYFELGKILVIEGKKYEALSQFQKATSFLQDDIELHYEIAKTYYELKNYERSKQEFLKVQRINKTYKDTEKYLALIEEKEKSKRQ